MKRSLGLLPTIQKIVVKNAKMCRGFYNVMDEHYHRLTYLHLMNRAAESGDQQSYFHYLMKAEKVSRWRDEGQSAEAFDQFLRINGPQYLTQR